MMTTLSNSNRIRFGRYYVEIYVQYHEKLYNLLIGAVIEIICHLYYNETESFSQIDTGKRLELNNTNLIAKLASKGASTAYGNIKITKRLDILSYKWTFNIRYKRWTMFIGLDSNSKFGNSDFSNFYRNFRIKHNDIFCAFGSDGNLYHNDNRYPDQYGIEWKTGDIMHLRIDCDQWTLTFYLNEQNLGTYNLTPDKKYYPAISMGEAKGYQLKILG